MAWVRVCTAEREDMQREREKGPTEHDILGRPAHLANGGSTNAMDPHVRLRSSLVSAPTCPSWNRRARARSAPARVARLLARTAGIFWGALEVLCKAKQSSSALRAILAARYARHFGLFLGPLRGQGAHMGSMAPCCKTLLFPLGHVLLTPDTGYDTTHGLNQLIKGEAYRVPPLSVAKNYPRLRALLSATWTVFL